MASNSKRNRSAAQKQTISRGSQVRPGDATGMENERLRRENQAAIKDAATRTTMVNPPPVVEQNDQVIDYSDGGDPNVGGGEEGVRLLSMDEATSDGTPRGMLDIPDEEVDMDALPDGKSDVLPEVVDLEDEPQPAHGARRDSQQAIRRPDAPQQRVEQRAVPKVEAAHRIMRVNTDLEDITIGKDNHYTFRQGQPYKVPAHVYEHLDEKGYVFH